MFSQTDIQSLVDRIVEHFHPEQVILFGSYAYGKPSEDSDIDLMVILNYPGREIDQIMAIKTVLGYPKRVDLKLRTPEQAQKQNTPQYLVTWHALNQGKVLYDRSRRRLAS